MDQHPVPQNISSYEFRLVGDMTLKQFFQLAGGAALGFVFFKMPLPFFIKWPLIAICVLTGILMAFVPVGGRPFSQWLMAFFKAIYSPTEFYWNFSPALAAEIPATNLPPPPQTPLDKFETQIVSRVTQLFGQSVPVTPAPATTNAFVPEPPAPVEPESAPQPASPTMTTYIKIDAVTQKPRLVTESIDAQSSSQEIAQTTPANAPKSVYEAPPASPYSPVVSYEPLSTAAPAITTNVVPAPTRINLIVGLVTASDNNPIEGAIIEISNTQTGIPVRALRTNKTGQFQTATPLNSGSYTLMVEKDNFTFSPATITVTDQIIAPVLIKAN